MDSLRFRALVDLVGAALERPASERDRYLVERCGRDATMLNEARDLVRQAEATSLTHVTAELQGRIGRAAAAVSDDAERLPDRIGPYRIIGILGSGGMGVIYRAERLSPLRRDVALKVIRGSTAGPQVIQRFEAERQALAVMDHPGIARVYNAGTTDEGLPYFAMELVDGLPITTYCRERGLDPPTRLRLFVNVCRAVQHAHQKGVIHRDLKPANVLVGEVDGRPVPKVIDFGIAKATQLAHETEAVQTEDGTMMGTLEYMSPEQASLSVDHIDTRADVYSLGVILYELITGRLPFESETLRSVPLMEAQRLIVDTEPPRPSALVRTVQDLDWVLIRALEKDPDRRYQSPNDLADDVERMLDDQPVEAGPPSVRYRLAKYVRRHRVGVAASAATLLAILAGAAMATVGFVRATAAHRDAERVADRAQTVSDFLQDMLSSVQPAQALGEAVTVREVLDEAAASLDSNSDVAADPEIEATIRFTIGDSYQALGEYDRSLPFLERALELRREHLTEDDERLPMTISRLGMVYWLRGDLDAALEMAQEELAIRERTVGRMHPDYVGALLNVGNTYADMGRFEEAEQIHRQALAIDREILREDQGGLLAITVNGLATVLADRKRWDEAIALHEESITLRRKHHGDSTPSVAIALSNLAYAQDGAGRLVEAESTAVEALAIAERVFGDDHLRTAIIRTRLASIFEQTGRRSQAEAYWRRAIDVTVAASGDRSPRVAAQRARLGKLLVATGRTDEGLDLLEEAWDVLADAYGADHARSRDVADRLAHQYEAVGAKEIAAAWRERAVAGQE